jgi:hypothetical protein
MSSNALLSVPAGAFDGLTWLQQLYACARAPRPSRTCRTFNVILRRASLLVSCCRSLAGNPLMFLPVSAWTPLLSLSTLYVPTFSACSPGYTRYAFLQHPLCDECPLGSYSSGLNAVACVSCPAGLFVVAPAAPNCTGSCKCTPGYYCPSGRSFSAAGVTCEAGYYCMGGSADHGAARA